MGRIHIQGKSFLVFFLLLFTRLFMAQAVAAVLSIYVQLQRCTCSWQKAADLVTDYRSWPCHHPRRRGLYTFSSSTPCHFRSLRRPLVFPSSPVGLCLPLDTAVGTVSALIASSRPLVFPASVSAWFFRGEHIVLCLLIDYNVLALCLFRMPLRYILTMVQVKAVTITLGAVRSIPPSIVRRHRMPLVRSCPLA